MPRFSIILPCYQAEATIAQTLASLQAQKFADWEALCVDDGSTDATPALLRYAAGGDRRIRVLRNPGKGPSDARNHGAAEARGTYLAFCDADDLWTDNKLTLLDQLFTQTACDGAFARVAFFERRPEDSMTLSSVPATALTLPMLLGENPVCTMSNVTLRTETFRRSGGLRRDMVHNEDLDWLIRLVGEGARLLPVDRVLVHYRVSPGGLSANLQAMQAGRAEALKSAARFGFAPDRGDEAIHLRYLARRALRVGLGGTTALGLAVRGLSLAPARFLTPLHRGGGTLAGAALAPLLPASLRRSLFAR